MRKLNLTDEERKKHNAELKRQSYARCKDAANKRRREKYKANKAEILAYQREWYAKNRKHVKVLRRRKYYLKKVHVRKYIYGKKSELSKWKRMDEGQRERQRAACRAWYHRNIEAQHERSRKRRERERLERERLGLPPKKRMNVKRFTAEELAERKRRRKKMAYRIMMYDPDKYAMHIEKRRAYYHKNREKFREYQRKWRSEHTRKVKMQRRLYNDRRRMLCRESAEFYAHHRELQREESRRYLRRIGKVKGEYKPRYNMRIPDYCTKGKCFDSRSSFLWNNMSQSQMMSIREFRANQFRGKFCDRFGEVCR